ncbi:guanine nucleotide-binding protein-like 3 homolog [Aplysia californica]|uniref:Guanine nucleotide-binding protein-like 3 homolog n=1 Tax=Aplysia californica TaxID=6500 RepID=A0ABM0K1P7_APLCA|nr:guanine nucleotide-binding protein-like 3 homolog [Aplysia californica]
MAKIKKKSKRQSTKQRVKVERKVREHKRKLKKEAKKNPKKGRGKDPGIPNILPFKEEVIKEAEAYKERKEQERLKKKASQKKARERLQNQNRNLAGIMKDAQKRQAAYDKRIETSSLTEDLPSSNVSKSAENSRKTFYKEFSKVVETADVVLEVLDARDPLGSRCVELEDAVRSANGAKKLILVLNKIDLVPKENVEAWLKHLRLELPTVAFKASTQEQRNHLTQSKVDYFVARAELLKSSHCLGADVLMKLLRNYCRETEMSINVGVVGFPNTGKSSIINSLKRSRVCDVGAVPGITRAMQGVQLDKHIKLLDSPGVVLSTSTSDVAAVLRNVVKLEAVQDPVPCVEAILKRCQKFQMMLHYNVPDYKDTVEFLTLLARRMGKLKKGGVPDVTRAARVLLQDWNSGKITYYTAPPEKTDAKDSSVHIEAKIVSGFAKEFDINEIAEDEAKMMKDLPAAGAQHMLVPGMSPLTAVLQEKDLDKEDDVVDEDDMGDGSDEDDEENADDEVMEDDSIDADELKGVSVVPSARKKPGLEKKAPTAQIDFRHRNLKERNSLKTVGGLITKKDKKILDRKTKKKKKKADALAGKLSDAMTSALSAL